MASAILGPDLIVDPSPCWTHQSRSQREDSGASQRHGDRHGHGVPLETAKACGHAVTRLLGLRINLILD